MSHYKESIETVKNTLKQMRGPELRAQLKKNGYKIEETKELYQEVKKILLQSHIFKIRSGLLKLFSLTDYEEKKIQEMRLPYSNVFIDCKLKTIEIEEGKETPYEILGICLSEVIGGEIAVEEIKKGDLEEIAITIIKRNIQDKTTSTEISTHSFSDLEDEEKENKEFNLEIKAIIINFLDFLNNPDIEFNKQTKSKDELGAYEKKYSKGMSTITLNGKIKKYVEDIERRILKNPNFVRRAHWVRGHWKRWENERFVNKKGTKTWVYPFIRGVGGLEKNQYKLKKDEEVIR